MQISNAFSFQIIDGLWCAMTMRRMWQLSRVLTGGVWNACEIALCYTDAAGALVWRHESVTDNGRQHQLATPLAPNCITRILLGRRRLHRPRPRRRHETCYNFTSTQHGQLQPVHGRSRSFNEGEVPKERIEAPVGGMEANCEWHERGLLEFGALKWHILAR